MHFTKTVTTTKEITISEGCIVRVRGRSSTDEVVIEATQLKSEAYDGSYYANVMRTIVKSYLGVSNPPVKTYLLPGSSMGVQDAVEIKMEDVEVLGQINLKKVVTTQYLEN